MSERTLRENTKRIFKASETPNFQELKIGSLLRIADSMEIISKDREKLIRERKRLIESRDYWRNKYEEIRRTNIGYRGFITRLKKQILKLKSN